MNKIALTAISLLCFLCHTTAQERRITSARMLGVGYTAIQDTYLSPLHYHGVELRYVSDIEREKDSCRWSRVIINEGYVSRSTPRYSSNVTYAGTYHFQYGWIRRWYKTPRLTVKAGVQAEVLLGVLYNDGNGNNPAQARVVFDCGPLLKASYIVKHNPPCGKRNTDIALTYEASAPLLGLTFSPQYGQSYYEIFHKNNYDHNCVPVTIGSIPSLRQMLTVDFPLLGTTWRAGYLGDYRQQSVNNLKRHVYSHNIMIGVKINR